jgi:curved DNA-binding protein CbpA
LLSLDSTQATGHDIKQQFRKLALLVHPDRCTVVGASKAFVALQSAVDVLISQAAIEVQGDDAARATKRAKNADAAAADGTDEYGDFEYDVDASSFAWWTEWDDATCTTQRSKPRSYVESKTEALLKQEMEKKAADADAALLAAMDVETLRREVRARQEAMWAPPGGSSCKSEHEGQVGGEIPTLQQLKAAMLRARSALVGKLNASKTISEENAVGRAEQEGGFLR